MSHFLLPCTALLMSAISVAGATGPTVVEETVKNAGFEEGLDGWTVAHFWGGSDGQAKVDRSIAHTGKASVKLLNPVRSFGINSASVPVVRGYDYEISFRAKVQDFSTSCFPWFSVTFYDGDDKYMGYVRFSYCDFAGLPPNPIRSEKWQKYSYVISSTDSRLSKAKGLRVGLCLGRPYFSKTKQAGETVVWYDDVKVVRRAAPLHLGETGVEFNALFFRDRGEIQPITFPVHIANPHETAAQFEFRYLVRRFSGEGVLAESEDVKLATGQQIERSIEVQPAARGYYEVVFSLHKGEEAVAQKETNFAVMEDLSDGKFDDDSPFGFHCHDLEGAGWLMEKIGVKWVSPRPLGFNAVEL